VGGKLGFAPVKKHRLRMFKNRLRKGIFGTQRGVVTVG
jgi:hypothetical protein